jgi:hypothetical protein
MSSGASLLRVIERCQPASASQCPLFLLSRGVFILFLLVALYPFLGNLREH